jgi:hypothetical protein
MAPTMENFRQLRGSSHGIRSEERTLFGRYMSMNHWRPRLDIRWRTSMTTCINTMRTIGMTLGLAIMASTAATSSGLAYSAGAQQMCSGDAMRLCSSEIPSIPRIIACMRRNKANVSAGCRMVMEQEDPASRPNPVQVAPAEQKPPAVARTEPPATAKSVPAPIAPVVPPVVALPAPVAPANVAAEPVEHRPAAMVAQPAAVETKPAPAVSFERTTIDVRLEQPQPARVDPSTTGQSLAAALAQAAQAAVTEVKRTQGVPIAATPPASVPAQPAPVLSKPEQAAPVEQKPIVAAPSVVKPTEVKPAPVAKPVKVARRKQRAQQVAVATYSPSGMGGYESYIGMAAPIMSLIMSHW